MKKITKTTNTGKIKLAQEEEVESLSIRSGVKAGTSFRSPVSFKSSFSPVV